MTHIKYLAFLFFFFSCVCIGYGQHKPIYLYDFDQCSLKEDSGFGNDAVVQGSKSCGCGVRNDALKFTGSETIELGQDVNQILTKDFSIDFYFNIESAVASTDLLSIQKSCDLDSSFYLRYLPQTGEIILEISENVGQYYSIKGLVGNNCWNRVTIVKSKLDYSLYANNELLGFVQANRDVPVSKEARIRFSGSECSLKTDDKLVGLIDEIAIYNRALTKQDLLTSYLFPALISSRDTTIFLGSTVDLNVGATCYDELTWSPTIGLSNPNSLSTVASPTETTTYNLSLTSSGCEQTSEVTINVVEPKDKNCGELLIPAAFTPNNDNLNDNIGISNTFIVDEIKSFQITDRWGGWVANLKDKGDKWDGTKNGIELPGGSYIYKVSYTCENKTYSRAGSFLMLK